MVPGCFGKPELLPVAFSSHVPAAGSSAAPRPGAGLKELFLWHTVLLGPFPAGAASTMLGAAQTLQGWFPRVSGSTARDERPFLAHCLPAPGGSWVPGCRQGSGSCHSPWKAGVLQPLQPAAFSGISAGSGLQHCSSPHQIRGRWGGGASRGNFAGSSRHMAPAGLAGDRGWQREPPVPFPAEPPRSPPAANAAGAAVPLGSGMGLCQPCQPSVTQGDGSERAHGWGQTLSLPHGHSSGSSFLCRAPLTSAASAR